MVWGVSGVPGLGIEIEAEPAPCRLKLGRVANRAVLPQVPRRHLRSTRGAAFATYGCSLRHVGLQPPSHRVAASISCGYWCAASGRRGAAPTRPCYLVITPRYLVIAPAGARLRAGAARLQRAHAAGGRRALPLAPAHRGEPQGAVTVCVGGCNRTYWGLKPYVLGAVTVCIGGFYRMCWGL